MSTGGRFRSRRRLNERAVRLDLRARDVLAIYGPALARRAGTGPFTVALDPARGLPCTVPADAGKLVTVRETADP